VEDIKQYIESGILELYVLNDLTPEEKLEVEKNAEIYPAIKQELNEISQTMELFADHNAIEPRESLREIVINQLISEPSAEINPVSSKKVSDKDNKVVSLKPVNQTYFYKYAFAASVALLLVSLVALVSTYNSLQRSRQQLVSLQTQNQKFANQVNFQENQLNQYKNRNGSVLKPELTDSIITNSQANAGELVALENALKRSKDKILALEAKSKDHEKEINIFSDPDSRFIKLKGIGNSSSMLLAWNPEKKKLWIAKKASGLPVNDNQHQYQLWAIRKLKPISLGVFDVRKADSVMESMSSIDRASAFAVTLEPRGGSEKPTLKQMVMMGLAHK